MKSTMQRELEHGTRLYLVTYTSKYDQIKTAYIRCQNYLKAMQLVKEITRAKSIERVETINEKANKRGLK